MVIFMYLNRKMLIGLISVVGSTVMPHSQSMAQTYNDCKKEILRKNLDDASAVRKALKFCQKKHPIHKSISVCKKDAMKKTEDKRNLALKRCGELASYAAYESKSNLPFVLYDRQIVVDGQEFNKVRDFNWIISNGMDCSELTDAIEKFNDANFFFHGMDLSKLGIKSSLLKKSLKKVQKGEYHFQPFFQLDTKSKGPLAFFPVGRCDYTTPKNPFINAVSQFYLIDYTEKKLYPYNIVFFYNENKAPDLNNVRKSISQRSFGRVVSETNKKGRVIIADLKLRDFDEEGDPKNICSGEKKSGIFFTVNHHDDQTYKADTALLTNVSSYCSYKMRILRHVKISLEQSR